MSDESRTCPFFNALHGYRWTQTTVVPPEDALEQIVTRLSPEAGVTAISWQVVAAVDTEENSFIVNADWSASPN